MTMPRFNQLTKYWLEFPPNHLSLVGIKTALGIKPASKTKQRTGTDDYEAPQGQTTNDLTQLVNASPFGDAFGMKRLKVIEIDARKKN